MTNTCGTVADTIVVNYNPPPSIDLGNDTALCQGQLLTLDATAPNASYLWQNNSTNPTYNVTLQGIYSVQVTNTCGTVADTIVVNYNPLPNTDLGNDTTLCQGEVLTLDVTTPSAFYQWKGNSTNPTYTITQQGTYWVTVTANNCSSQDTIIVNFNPVPNTDLGNDTTLCQGEILTLKASTPGASYLWQDNSTNPTYNVTLQGTYSVTVTINNCSSSDTINVNFNPVPNIDLGNDTTLCQGALLTLDATTPNAFYIWQDNSTNPTYNVTQKGTYWVCVNANNCSSLDTINVNFNLIPNTVLGNDTTLCQGALFTLDATTANSSYLWQDSSTNPTFNVSQQGTYWVQLLNNCGTIADTIVVNYTSLPPINLGNDTVLCQGEQFTLDASTPNASYLWQNNSTSSTYIVNQPGTYGVTVSVNNCSSADLINVLFNPLPNLDLGSNAILCDGDILTFDIATFNASYLWQDNSINPAYIVTEPGTYWVNLSVNNCTASDSINVDYQANPNAIVSNDTNICLGSSIVLNASGGDTYVWSPSAGLSNPFVSNPLASPLGTTIYTVNVESDGCFGSDTVIIEVDPECSVFVPDIFSPNGDGNNDVVYVQGKGIKEIHFAVFDRWGKKIFETTDISEGWDGTFKGKKLNSAVFVYYLEAVFISGKEIADKGDITLIR
ncbi:MAG: gliding motility-associated C-terminal domain-containing protein [Flavobacteriales bacterium]|nr:gliding motility-associated C-terminal domain-containing protein [Flavobacteriales bacterium]